MKWSPAMTFPSFNHVIVESSDEAVQDNKALSVSSTDMLLGVRRNIGGTEDKKTNEQTKTSKSLPLFFYFVYHFTIFISLDLPFRPGAII